MKFFKWFMMTFGMCIVYSSIATAQIGWWGSQDSVNIFTRNRGGVMIGAVSPFAKLTVGGDAQLYNLALVSDMSNLSKNYLKIGVLGQSMEKYQGHILFDLYHSNTQSKYAGFNFRINGNSMMFINGDGNIGLGTELPEGKIHIKNGPDWNGLKNGIVMNTNTAIRFETGSNQFGLVGNNDELNFVLSNPNKSAFDKPFFKVLTVQPKKIVIDGDLEVRGKIYNQGYVSDNPIDPVPIDPKGGGIGPILSLAAGDPIPSDSGWIGANGGINYPYGKVGINVYSPNAMLHLQTSATNSKGLIIQKTTSQSANLLEFQDENGVTKSYFNQNSAGVFVPGTSVLGSDHTNFAVKTTSTSRSSYVDIIGGTVNWQLGHHYYNNGTFAIGRAIDVNSNFSSGQRPNEITIYSNGAVAIGGINTSEDNQFTINGRTTTPLAGTVSVAAGTNTVTGVGTSFTTQLKVGQAIKINNEKFVVAYITNNTSLTLSANHSSGAASVTAFKDMDNLFTIRKGNNVRLFDIDKTGNAVLGSNDPYLVSGVSRKFFEIADSTNPGLALTNTKVGGRQYFLYSNAALGSFRIYDASGSTDRLVIDSSGNVAIGTTTPYSKLYVEGMNGNPLITANAKDSFGSIGLQSNGQNKLLLGYNWGAGNFGSQTAAGDVSIFANTNLHIAVGTSGNHPSRMTFATSGKIGVGKTNPTYNLDVAGILNADSILVKGVSISGSGNQWVQADTNLYYNSGNVGIGTSTPGAKLDIYTAGPAGAHITADGHIISLRGVNDPLNYSPHLPYIQWVMKDSTRAMYLGWGNTSGNRYVDMALENGFNLAINGGYVGIGTTNPTEMLTVNGNVRTKKVIVTQQNWSDFVFDKDYKLRSLAEVEDHIQQHKHLPDIPSEKEIKESGLDVGDVQAKLLQKIEELTLYVIEQNKRIQNLEEQLKVKSEAANARRETKTMNSEK